MSPETRSATAPRGRLPARPYWGWVMVSGLGVTACVSYGVLAYSFAVFLAPMEAELGWSRSALTGAFSLAFVVTGLASLPLGRWVDRHGARLSMTAGSALAALLLVAWSHATSLTAFYAIFLLMGVACAAVFYEPSFAVVAHWFDRRRSAALTLLTFLGGLASVIFVPTTSWLVATRGWREALLWLAVILASVSIPIHALLLRRRPQDHGLLPDGDSFARPAHERVALTRGGATLKVGEAVRTRQFRFLAIGFAMAQLCSTAMVVHLVPLLLERGYGTALAAGVAGSVGLMALPGRLLFTPLGGRFSRGLVTALIFALQAIGIVVLLAVPTTAGVWTFAACFGAGFGAITPARAAMVADLFGAEAYASISGVLAVVLAAAAAAAPVGASLLRDAGGDYRAVLLAMLVASAISAWMVIAANRRDPVSVRKTVEEPA